MVLGNADIRCLLGPYWQTWVRHLLYIWKYEPINHMVNLRICSIYLVIEKYQ